MDSATLLNAQVQAKRMYGLLNEVLDVTHQLTEAVDRDDKVSIEMLLHMRAEPLEKLQHLRRSMELECNALSQEDGQRMVELLNGAAAKVQEETGLANQVGANARLLRQVVEIDERINRKLTRDKSVYKS
jgi:hypothetical protein